MPKTQETNISGEVYRLPPSDRLVKSKSNDQSRQSLSEPMLLINARLFCRYRWLVAALLLGLGCLGQHRELLIALGLSPPGFWPFAAAGILILANVALLVHLQRLAARQEGRQVNRNLWGQIILDLLVLTFVVHFVGSTQTSISFVYVFHIVLSCIFFSRRNSFLVMLLSASLYVCCILLEHARLLPPSALLVNGIAPDRPPLADYLLNPGLVIVLWLAVWQLCSRLSDMVRRRDSILAETNLRLIEAQRERSRHMLTTTHELKAPFAAIHAYTQVLLEGHCGQLPSNAIDVIRRMEARCRRLAGEIQEMLQLANLSSDAQSLPPSSRMDLAEQIRDCLAQIEPMAQVRQISFCHSLKPAPVLAAPDHLKMLLVNLLGNAVIYSHAKGVVEVECCCEEGLSKVHIRDHGIGIPKEKLPLIFEEYYRTPEAVRHNKDSSGLGLAIVRRIGSLYGIEITVHSHSGAGTSFDLTFPALPEETAELATGQVDEGFRPSSLTT